MEDAYQKKIWLIHPLELGFTIHSTSEGPWKFIVKPQDFITSRICHQVGDGVALFFGLILGLQTLHWPLVTPMYTFCFAKNPRLRKFGKRIMASRMYNLAEI